MQGELSSSESIEQRRAEYDAHVWNHVDDAFQQSFDSRRKLTSDELKALRGLVQAVSAGSHDDDLALQIRQYLSEDNDRIWILLQLVGLTRNKILTDLKSIAAAMDDGPRIPSSADRVFLSDDVWKLAGPYLVRAVRRPFSALAVYNDPRGALEAINQATWPAYIRQERAKRQGHEAEGRIAQLLLGLDIPFAPEKKAENPLSPDAQIAGVSFDIVSPDIELPVLVVESTVQTANIGQFGQSKVDLEIREAQQALSGAFGDQKPVLVAFVDGVGFYSNTQGRRHRWCHPRRSRGSERR